MIDGRRLAHIYKTPLDTTLAFDEFVAGNSASIASLDYRRLSADMRNGDRVYFYTIRNRRDVMPIAGMELNSATVYKDMDEETRQYVVSRLRDPRGGHLVEYDLIEREDV